MGVEQYFSASYAEARRLFLETARSAGAEIASYVHHGEVGPAGEPLAIDVARLGAEDCSSALLIVSGTHGVEAFCGSGCQVGLLQDRLYEALPASTCLVMVHALNPYGFAWVRRVNEDGVDLNRNFVDFTRPLPDSQAYEHLHDWLVPADIDGPVRASADAALADFIERHGMAAYQAAVSTGQYTRPAGLFYGGVRRTWSAMTLQRLIAEHLPPAVRMLAVLDIHTGLGPAAYGEPIAIGAASSVETARAWYGPEVTSLDAGDSISAKVVGVVPDGIAEVLPDVELVYVALEFGTQSIGKVVDALRADHWLHATSGVSETQAAGIRRQVREAFFGDTPAWKAAVYGRTADFFMRAARALSS